MPTIDFFPKGFKPKKEQKYVLSQIDKAIENGKKFIFISAPPGVGKSHIAATLALASSSPTPDWRDFLFKNRLHTGISPKYMLSDIMKFPAFGSFILTISKQLQNQYEDIFSDHTAYSAKGKSNYICNVDTTYSADMAPCVLDPKIKTDCLACSNCDYYNAKIDVLSYKFSILNYSMYFTIDPALRRREFLICDEASELEDEIVNNYSFEVDFRKLKYFEIDVPPLKSDDLKEVKGWLNDLETQLQNKCAEYLRVLEGKPSKKKPLYVSKFKQIQHIGKKLNNFSEYFYKTQYVIERDSNRVMFTPLYVDKIAHDLFATAETVVLMSGTMGNPKIFAQTLGITDYEYIEVESPYDPDKSPIYCLDKYPLSYKTMDQNLPKVLKATKKLCNEHHFDVKGLIHTHTHKITEKVKETFKNNKRFIIRDIGITNEDLLEEHMQSKEPTVLVSPSMAHGVSLDGDLGVFQIVIKLPYLSLASQRIKILAKKSKDWYESKMINQLMQQCGRTTRSLTDSSTTYILDGNIERILKANWESLPKWFKNRIK